MVVERDDPVEPWWRRWGIGLLAFVLVASLMVIGVNVYWTYFA
jgi:predicted negative regulator of RcsB-dependent stress response